MVFMPENCIFKIVISKYNVNKVTRDHGLSCCASDRRLETRLNIASFMGQFVHPVEGMRRGKEDRRSLF